MEKTNCPYRILSNFFCEYNKINKDTPFEILEMQGVDLVVQERLDIMAKVKFIEAYETGIGILEAEELYKMHLDAFTDGLFTEPGSREKNTYEKYRDSFIKLIHNFKEQGFREDISLIPVGQNNVALDGSHRIACAVYFGRKIKVIRFNHLYVNYNYEYFRKRLLLEKYILHMVKKYIEIKGNSYAVFVWPKDFNMKKIIFESIDKYQAKVLYKRRSYDSHPNRSFMILHGISTEQAFALKQDLCERIGDKKRSLHMTDNNEETLEDLSRFINFYNCQKTSTETGIWFVKKKIRFLYTYTLIYIKKKLGIPV